jgi:cytochrome P450 family 135
MLVAGHETTATALAWGLERLARSPAALDRLEAELDAGEDAYLDATVSETLRIRPVVPFALRELTEPMRIGGFDLPAGTRAAPCGWLLHRRPDVYPDPDAFTPERFLETPPGTYTWIPFGGGTRRCLGASFSMFEMKHVRDHRHRRGRRGLRPPRRHLRASRRHTAAPTGAHTGPTGGSAAGITPSA